MILGIVRHFKVDFKPQKFLYTPRQFEDALVEYDSLPVIPNKINIDSIPWEVCYCSTLPRAKDTAENIFKGEILYTDLLKEIPISAVTDRNLKLPAFWWHFTARIAWYRNNPTQKEPRLKSIERINRLLKLINTSGYNRVLLVTHGFFMEVLFKELLKMGFEGKYDLHPPNGKLYIFEIKTQNL